MTQLILHDPTLRDGNHALKHQISLEQIRAYIRVMDSTGIDVIEVGHGLGLGASSLQLGLAKQDDRAMLRCARQHIKHAKLGVHITPGYGHEKDLMLGIEEGADVIRVATHCTEADIAQTLIKLAKEYTKPVYGCLTMSHMATEYQLLEQTKKLESYGADGVILMDSAGAYTAEDVKRKVSHLHLNCSIQIGFHAHNNLSLAVSNTIIAADCGATILDGTAKGFGAGCGNTPLEILVALLVKKNYPIKVDILHFLNAIDEVATFLTPTTPPISTNNIASGLYGVFTGFETHVNRISSELNIDAKQLLAELGKRQLIAGQEDLILESAYKIKMMQDIDVTKS
jgi:4-hydroxy 2-oxovalerate aldolase